MDKIIKFAFILIALNISGCVGLDRTLIQITDHTHHYSFNHQDILQGGLLVGGLVRSNNNSVAFDTSGSAAPLARAIKSERKEFTVNSIAPITAAITAPTIGSFNEHTYYRALNQYKHERWIDVSLLNEIRLNFPERYIIFARVEGTNEYQSSNSHKQKKDKENKNDSNENDEQYNDDAETYDTYRKSVRSATISADVFDLAQDIIVWSGTRKASITNKAFYSSDHPLGEHTYTEIYPYPDYPSWDEAYQKAAKDLIVHFPHKAD